MKETVKSTFVLTLAMALSLMLASGASAQQKQFWYYDGDSDGYGDPATEVWTNHPDPGYIPVGGDLDDGDNSIYPGAPELCDGLPNDCSNPLWPALPATETDDDGDGFVECVLDGGGWFGAPVTGGRDCDDTWLECYPGSAACECTVVNTVASAGQIWMDRNLGASQAATSIIDEAAYGDLYQWGRGPDGHQLRTSATTATTSSTDDPGHGDFITVESSDPGDWRVPQNDTLWQGVNGTNNPCPAGFRLPTVTELETERLSWPSNDRAGAFASPLKLLSCGLRHFTGFVSSAAAGYGYYWSSTAIGIGAGYLFISPSDADNIGHPNRVWGYSVRCLKD